MVLASHLSRRLIHSFTYSFARSLAHSFISFAHLVLCAILGFYCQLQTIISILSLTLSLRSTSETIKNGREMPHLANRSDFEIATFQRANPDICDTLHKFDDLYSAMDIPFQTKHNQMKRNEIEKRRKFVLFHLLKRLRSLTFLTIFCALFKIVWLHFQFSFVFFFRSFFWECFNSTSTILTIKHGLLLCTSMDYSNRTSLFECIHVFNWKNEAVRRCFIVQFFLLPL